MDSSRRARIHAALADPHRLALVDTLALGDRSPAELGAELGLASNLLAHHLKVLEEARLVERRISEGDGRRRYVVLRRDAMADAVRPLDVGPRPVLFVCTHNSARSQFAAGLWRHATGSRAESAGTDPAPQVHPMAVAAASERGIDLSAEVPKGYDEVTRDPGLVVSVCDRAHEAPLPFAAARLHWSVRDPVRHGELPAFRTAFDEIAARVTELAAAVDGSP